MELHFLDYRFGEPKYSELECRQQDRTFSKPLYVDVELVIEGPERRARSLRQQVYFGDFPFMTDQGTFIINGAERVVVSQLVRSPGVYYTRTEDPDHGARPVRRQGDPEPGRLAGVRDRPAAAAVRQGRSQAEARGDQAPPRGRAGHGPIA